MFALICQALLFYLNSVFTIPPNECLSIYQHHLNAPEYMSIDCVKLGLPIPEWAEEMLQKEQGHAVTKRDGMHYTPMLLSTSSSKPTSFAIIRVGRTAALKTYFRL
jgi:hypothetical protein